MQEIETHVDEMQAEYDFDYKKAKPNRFAEKYNQAPGAIMLEPDVARVFPNSAAVNEALRFLIRVAQQNQSSTEISK